MECLPLVPLILMLLKIIVQRLVCIRSLRLEIKHSTCHSFSGIIDLIFNFCSDTRDEVFFRLDRFPAERSSSISTTARIRAKVIGSLSRVTAISVQELRLSKKNTFKLTPRYLSISSLVNVVGSGLSDFPSATSASPIARATSYKVCSPFSPKKYPERPCATFSGVVRIASNRTTYRSATDSNNWNTTRS